MLRRLILRNKSTISVKSLLNCYIHDTNLIDIVYQYHYQSKLEVELYTNNHELSSTELLSSQINFYSDNQPIQLKQTDSLSLGFINLFGIVDSNGFLTQFLVGMVRYAKDVGLPTEAVFIELAGPKLLVLRLPIDALVYCLPEEISKILENIYRM